MCPTDFFKGLAELIQNLKDCPTCGEKMWGKYCYHCMEFFDSGDHLDFYGLTETFQTVGTFAEPLVDADSMPDMTLEDLIELDKAIHGDQPRYEQTLGIFCREGVGKFILNIYSFPSWLWDFITLWDKVKVYESHWIPRDKVYVFRQSVNQFDFPKLIAIVKLNFDERTGYPWIEEV